MVRMQNQRGIVMNACDSDVERFLALGYKKLDEKQTTKRRAPRKTEKPDQK